MNTVMVEVPVVAYKVFLIQCQLLTVIYFSFLKIPDWFRTARGLELLAFMSIVATMILVVVYMFFLREVKYVFLQWIITGLCFAAGW